jgi:divalent metal cation (Fe/Co/Zn/Cd) transporter
MRSLLIGESADNGTLLAIEAAIEREPLIERMIHLRTMHLGPDQLLIAAKVAVQAGETMAHVAQAINRAEKRVRDELSYECFIFLEPDVFDARLYETAERPPGSSSQEHREAWE